MHYLRLSIQAVVEIQVLFGGLRLTVLIQSPQFLRNFRHCIQKDIDTVEVIVFIFHRELKLHLIV